MYFRMRFAKFGVMKFIGHLDVMRYFQKAVRRSGLPVKYSQGYNPHQLLVFAQPLGVGVTSDGEYLDIEIEEDAPEILRACSENGFDAERLGKEYPDDNTASSSAKYVSETLSKALTEGFEIISCRYIPWKENEKNPENSMSLVMGADYLVSLKNGYFLGKSDAELQEDWSVFIARQNINVVKKTKSGEKSLDIRPYIYRAEIKTASSAGLPEDVSLGTKHADTYESGTVFYLRLAAGSSVNIKPELVITAFCESAGIIFNEFAFQIHRMNMFRDVLRGEEL